ncbi:PCI domain-containing protein [Globomyces pollinis-pini]|nr:PCI domain-containing protein [Globomyces pollinis-pini]
MPSAQDLQTAESLIVKEPVKAVEKFKSIYQNTTGVTDEDLKIKETCVIKLGDLYRDLKKSSDLATLISQSLPFLTTISKAKTSKIVKTLIDNFSDIPDALPLQVKTCKETIDWAVAEKRIFLRQSLETRLCALYLHNKMYSESLALIDRLLKELKRLDDKNVLMEVQLLESCVYHALRNLPKSRAALTSARTSANSIYCPPLMQAAIDLQSGILHAEEKDYKTAFSYFYEAMESFTSQEDKRGMLGLKYMMLCKIMLNLPDDVHNITNGKLAIKHSGPDIEAMNAIATALEHRSLQEFEQVLQKYKAELSNDAIIRTHLAALYDNLFEKNLLRIIEPFSRVEISHVAQLVKLPTAQVETKLSQMILDQVFSGILDQGAGGCLEVFEDSKNDKTYEASLATIKNMENVVQSLYHKAGTLNL